MTHDHPAAKEQAKLPTPARPVRHNEWTGAKMVAFLKELAATPSRAAWGWQWDLRSTEPFRPDVRN
jgi:hypothetical protein